MSLNQKKLVNIKINKPKSNTKAPALILCIKKANPVTRKNTPKLATKGHGLGETK
jgi:hypothetical protein